MKLFLQPLHTPERSTDQPNNRPPPHPLNLCCIQYARWIIGNLLDFYSEHFLLSTTIDFYNNDNNDNNNADAALPYTHGLCVWIHKLYSYVYSVHGMAISLVANTSFSFNSMSWIGNKGHESITRLADRRKATLIYDQSRLTTARSSILFLWITFFAVKF